MFALTGREDTVLKAADVTSLIEGAAPGMMEDTLGVTQADPEQGAPLRSHHRGSQAGEGMKPPGQLSQGQDQGPMREAEEGARAMPGKQEIQGGMSQGERETLEAHQGDMMTPRGTPGVPTEETMRGEKTRTGPDLEIGGTPETSGRSPRGR